MANHDPSLAQECPTDELPRSPFEHRVIFVVLVFLGFVLFAPTLLLPLLQEHCDLLAEEARIEQRIEDLRNEITRRDVLITAFTRDKVIVERLARLDLRFRKPGEVVVPILPELTEPEFGREEAAAATASADHILKLPEKWPAWTHRARQWADQRGLLAVFLNANVRPVFYLMSAGLVIAAFVLFAPRVRAAQTSEPRIAPKKAG